MSKNTNSTTLIGHVSMLNLTKNSLQHGKLMQNNFYDKKLKLQVISYSIVSSLSPVFFWGRGSTVYEAINSFITICSENNRIPLIEPQIFNLIVHEQNSYTLNN